MKVYTIYDKVAEESGPVFCAVNDGVALRNFKAMLQQQNVSIYEYKLYCLGSYDAKTMIIMPTDPREVVLVEVE